MSRVSLRCSQFSRLSFFTSPSQYMGMYMFNWPIQCYVTEGYICNSSTNYLGYQPNQCNAEEPVTIALMFWMFTFIVIALNHWRMIVVSPTRYEVPGRLMWTSHRIYIHIFSTCVLAIRRSDSLDYCEWQTYINLMKDWWWNHNKTKQKSLRVLRENFCNTQTKILYLRQWSPRYRSLPWNSGVALKSPEWLQTWCHLCLDDSQCGLETSLIV